VAGSEASRAEAEARGQRQLAEAKELMADMEAALSETEVIIIIIIVVIIFIVIIIIIIILIIITIINMLAYNRIV
jgi:hypothetical protein